MPAESARRPVVMLSAGEASGDLHGGALAAALRRLAPEARLFGMGGERMASAGVELLADARDMAVVGFTEAVRRLPHLRHTLAELRKALRSQRPDVLVTIDYPGFNLRLADADVVIGLLPVSRAQEIARLTPIIRAAAATLASRHPNARFVLALAPTVSAADVTAHLGAGPRIDLVSDAHAVMRASDLLLATSGTATLEAALLGTPMVVIYRLSWLSQAVGHAVLRIPWVTLPNIILGRGVIPELF